MNKIVILLLFPGFLLLSKMSAQPKYEFRGVWVATVSNIDWPSSGNYVVESQKSEFINLLNMHQRNGLNAVIVQVRPSTDAFYPSPYEPWSQWLTGKQGLPPSPYYDPLQFMIEETHKRGMEFHAWCNPYRAEFTVGISSISPAHITKTHPDWFLVYGNKRYFDPGNKEVQQYVTDVIRDMVKRYDVDAIHFDDYFYPYRIAGQNFPDDSTYAKYHNQLNREDWRRSNVDTVILSLSRVIKEENRFCKFGISPFGVWRNNDKDTLGSTTRAGQTNYDDLYADILLWLQKGWIDYVTPQLYWEIGHRLVAYEILIDWWSKHAYGRQLYIGHGIYKGYETNNRSWRNRQELPNQIKLLRGYDNLQGSAFYSSKSFKRNPNGWSDSLRENYYRYPAIVPPMKWIDTIRPAKPVIEKQNMHDWKFKVAGNNHIRYFILYNLNPQGQVELLPASIYKVLPAIGGEALFKSDSTTICEQGCVVTAVGRNNVESEWQEFK